MFSQVNVIKKEEEKKNDYEKGGTKANVTHVQHFQRNHQCFLYKKRRKKHR